MNRLEDWFDLQIWFLLQFYYWPHYVIGKQDEWKEWASFSLNGVKAYNICNPYR